MKKVEELYQITRARYCSRCEFLGECPYAKGRIHGECGALDDYLSGYEQAQQDTFLAIVHWLNDALDEHIQLIMDGDKDGFLKGKNIEDLKNEFSYN